MFGALDFSPFFTPSAEKPDANKQAGEFLESILPAILNGRTDTEKMKVILE